ncbi:hypothetical protein ACWGID_12180 [Kribbella sp. NPDC054772]
MRNAVAGVAYELRDVDRIYVFDQGHIVQQGDYHQLLQRSGRFAELLSEQLAGTQSLPSG